MPKDTLADEAANTIRSYILQGELKPGMRINIDLLAKHLAISQTPIREALKKLIAEGLATYLPKVGYSVRNLTLHEYLQVSEIHQLMEVYLMRKLAEMPFLMDFDGLEALNEEMAAGTRAHDIATIAEKNDRFHVKLYENYPNKLLTQRLDELCFGVRSLRDIIFGNLIYINKIADEHRNILAALRDGDPDAAEDAMNAHYLSARDCAIASFPVAQR